MSENNTLVSFPCLTSIIYFIVIDYVYLYVENQSLEGHLQYTFRF